MGHEADAGREEAADPLILDGRPLQAGDRLGAYVFQREIGSGGMARVLLASDPAGQPVALKVLRANRMETGLTRFQREFAALSRLHHPNIVRVDAFADLHGHPYIAMEYVDGPDLHTVIRQLKGIPDAERWVRVTDVLTQLCHALAALHRRGMVHRDLKPSNVLVHRDGTCKLTDFGIVKDLDPAANPQLSATLVGTWAYASPEHIMGQPIDHRSDLYSLGVILFALLTGKRPFLAEGMAGYLEAHRDKPAPRASSLRPGVPDVLDDICARLLEKSPRHRFQRAAEVLQRLGVQAASDADAGHGWSPPLVGHATARAEIDDALAGLTAGRGGVVHLQGEEGSGRSRVLQYAAEQAGNMGFLVASGAFSESDAPFTLTMQIARDLIGGLPPEAASDLGGVLSTWADGRGVRGDTRYALYDALREAFASALEERPFVLLLDDAHDVSALERDLVGYLLRTLVGTDARPLLVVSAGRRAVGWVEAGGDVRVAEVPLRPLEVDDVRALVVDLLGEERGSHALAVRLHRETSGNAQVVVEFLRSLIQRDLVVRRGDAWIRRLDAGDLAEGHLEIPPGIRATLLRRLEGLPTASRRVLDLLAVAGRSLGCATLESVLSETEVPDVDAVLLALREDGLLRERRRGDETVYAPVHRTLADLLVGALTADSRRDLHARLAEALEPVAVADPELEAVVGHHWEAAGDAAAALRHYLEAARRHLERSLPEAALALLPRIEAVEPEGLALLDGPDRAASRRAILHLRMDAHAHHGRWSEAVAAGDALLEAAALADDAKVLCDARLDLSRTLRQSGERSRSRELATLALRDARRLHDRSRVATALHCLAVLAWSEGDLDRCEELVSEGLLAAHGAAFTAERARLELAMALSLAMRGTLTAAIRHMAGAEALFRELRMKPQHVLALANVSELLTWAGEHEEALLRAHEAVRLAEGLGDVLGRVVALRARGTAYAAQLRTPEALADLLAGRALARASALYDDLVGISVQLTELALDRQDRGSALQHGMDGLGAARRGDPERYLPVLQADLGAALARLRPEVATQLLRAALRDLDALPAPRRYQVTLAAARGWQALGVYDEAVALTSALVRDRGARGFRPLQIGARDLLADVTTGEVSARHREVADQLRAESGTELRAGEATADEETDVARDTRLPEG